MNKSTFLNLVQPYTMTSNECIFHLYDTLEKIRIDNVEGDIAECGVWRAGNILGIIEYLQYHKMFDRNVWMYDTFSGMTKPSDEDFKNDGTSNNKDILNYWSNNKWCYCSLDDVKKNLSISNFPTNNIKYVIGDVCNTLTKDENIPDKLSLLRLDTDWYKSTKIELEILYPKLNKFGTLIVDDFNYWHGSKKAVIEYFNNDISHFKVLNSKSAVYKIKL